MVWNGFLRGQKVKYLTLTPLTLSDPELKNHKNDLKRMFLMI